MFVMADSFVKILETALKSAAAAPNLATAVVKLMKTHVMPTRNSVKTDFTEADYAPGYAAGTLGTNGPYDDAVSGPYLGSDLQTFDLGSPVTIGNTIYGYWIETAGGVYVGGELFPDPIPMESAGAHIGFVLEFRIRNY